MASAIDFFTPQNRKVAKLWSMTVRFRLLQYIVHGVQKTEFMKREMHWGKKFGGWHKLRNQTPQVFEGHPQHYLWACHVTTRHEKKQQCAPNHTWCPEQGNHDLIYIWPHNSLSSANRNFLDKKWFVKSFSCSERKERQAKCR